MIREINVKGTASKVVKSDLAVVTLGLWLADKNIETVTEKYNAFYRSLKDLVLSIDKTAQLSVSGLNIMTDEKTVESIFRITKNVKVCCAKASISITYEDNDLMYNKVLSFCEQNKEDSEDNRKSSSCLMYSCSKSAKVSRRLRDEIRTELISLAVTDAFKQAGDVVAGDTNAFETLIPDYAASCENKVHESPYKDLRLEKVDVEQMYVNGVGGNRNYKGACFDMAMEYGMSDKSIEVEQGDIYSQFSISVRATIHWFNKNYNSET